jgi:hypothetical protein
LAQVIQKLSDQPFFLKCLHCCAAAASEGVFFDAFSGSIQNPATVYMIFATFLMFCAAWDLVICMTTEPTLGPILRGIIQVRLIFLSVLPTLGILKYFHFESFLGARSYLLLQLLRDAHVLAFVGCELVFVFFRAVCNSLSDFSS